MRPPHQVRAPRRRRCRGWHPLRLQPFRPDFASASPPQRLPLYGTDARLDKRGYWRVSSGLEVPKGERMSGSVTWNETTPTIAGCKLHLMRGGSGRPVLVLHHDIGTPD